MDYIINLKDVSMQFHMPKERVDSIKELIIRFLKRNLEFERFYALRNVNMAIKKGEVVGLIGLNGSGKSTTLKVVSGILKPTEGSVSVKGSISPLIELGAGFDYDLTARENVFLNGSVLGFSKKMMTEKMDDIIDFAELRDFMDVAIKNYSSGMVARLGFSIATIVHPDILIVDEILSVGDFLFQQKCEKRLAEMMSGGTTVLIVSHSLAQIERLCDRVIWLSKGEIVMDGPTKEVCQAYKEFSGTNG